MATIFRSSSIISNPNGLKLKTDPSDYDQTLLIHDFSNPKTYPSQVNPVPNGTQFVNLSTTNAFKNQGFRVVMSNPVFDKDSKSIQMSGSPYGVEGDLLRIGATAAPYPLLGLGGQKTDFLVTMWLKIVHTDGDTAGLILNHLSTAGTSATNALFRFQYGVTLNTITAWGIGRQVSTNIPYTAGEWMQIALYIRASGYNGKTGLIRIYKNGTPLADFTTSIPTEFFTTDNTKDVVIGDQYGGMWGNIGRITMGMGLDAAGLNPNSMVLSDYTKGSSVWTN